MRSLYLIAALCAGIWMSVDGAIVECLVKINEERSSLKNEHPDSKTTVQHMLEQISNNIENENFQESLDKEIRNICYPSKIEEELYSLAMRIFKVCGNRDHPFTEKGKRIFENILKYSFCDGFMKLGVIVQHVYQDKCFKDSTIFFGLLKCSRGSSDAFGKFFSPNNTEMCTAQLETSICINQLLKGKCSDNTTNLIEYLLAGVRNISRCDSDANISVSNSTGTSSVFQISELDSELRVNTSTTESEETCKSKIENDEDIFRNISDFKHTLMSGFMNIKEYISKQNSVELLDSLVNDVCFPAMSDDDLYSLMTRVFRICLGQEDIFTEDGKQMFKSLVKPLFCNIPMKVASLGTFWTYDDCYLNISKLHSRSDITGPFFNTRPSPRYKFSENNSKCKSLTGVAESLNSAINVTCPASVSEKMESFSVEVLNFVTECHISIEHLEILRTYRFVH